MQLITGKTQLLGIIGDPVEHSLSPVMHNKAISEMGLDYVYVPFPVKRVNLGLALAGFEAIGVRGFSVTIPHKQDIMALLSEIDDDATNIGAVNTVWRTSKGWKGYNTDVTGFVYPLETMSPTPDWTQIQPLILGHGGAARAVIVGLINLGCQEIKVVGRNSNKLANFKQNWSHVPEIQNQITTHHWDNLSSLIPDADLLVNTTPVGMSPHIDASPVDENLMQGLRQDAIAYDLIYTPNPTQFLKLAQTQGATTIDGLEMLLQQGVAALKIWLQQPISADVVDEMRNSLRKYLDL